MQDTPDSRKKPRAREDLDPYTLERIRADRLRPVAFRQGLILVKSRKKEHRGLGNSAYHLVPAADRAMANSSPKLTLDEVEAALESGKLACFENIAWRTHKACTMCNTTKPVEDFYRRANSLDGRATVCKECSSAIYAEVYAANKEAINERSRRNMRKKREEDPDYTARAHLWSMFRMTLDEYDARLLAQGGVCAICGTPPGVTRLAVDHDHQCCPSARSCGACVRALLCSGCNNSTGITDDPFLLRRKADYIELWRFRHAEAAAQAG